MPWRICQITCNKLLLNKLCLHCSTALSGIAQHNSVVEILIQSLHWKCLFDNANWFLYNYAFIQDDKRPGPYVSLHLYCVEVVNTCTPNSYSAGEYGKTCNNIFLATAAIAESILSNKFVVWIMVLITMYRVTVRTMSTCYLETATISNLGLLLRECCLTFLPALCRCYSWVYQHRCCTDHWDTCYVFLRLKHDCCV